jgi:glycine betaine/proline transport system permease protein
MGGGGDHAVAARFSGVAMAGLLRNDSVRSLLVWSAVAVVMIASFLLEGDRPWLMRIDEGAGLPIPEIFDAAMDWFTGIFKPFFRVVSWLLEWPVYAFRSFYLWLPWPIVVVVVATTAHIAAGRNLAVFCVLALGYIVVAGFWDKAALTLALVTVALPLALAGGLTLGILGHRSPRVRRLIEPLLDFMQTIPTFAYLVPCLVLFGFGPTVGLIASATFALPPMARTVMLGLGRVPGDVVESAIMTGATERQLLWLVKLPAAMPSVMLGVNQTILATLSMVVIAAVLGSGEDLGWEVLYTMRQAKFGESLLTGVAIVLLAMMMDRITQGFARRREHKIAVPSAGAFWRRYLVLSGTACACAAILVVSAFVPALQSYPEAWTVLPYQPLDAAISWINTHYPEVTDNIRNWTLFYFMLPIKIGLDQVVTPFSWGFVLTPPLTAGYAVFVVVLACAIARVTAWRGALAVLFLGLVYYIGLTEMPWPAILFPAVVLAWRVGGWRIGLFALVSLTFMLTSGFWMRSMISVYLCGSAVAICIVVGVSLGIFAALNDRVSAIVRPVNDTLQSIPLFVFLIPVVVLFKVGEFAGLLAVVMYAIVPSIRYTELGIRQVDAAVIEAGRVMGCTRTQLLFRVQLPLALPEIMLGINQTVLFGLAMLVITALVGTKGLGQIIYRSLADGGFGVGITAALCMALIAMTTDRVIQSWSLRKKREYGLETD